MLGRTFYLDRQDPATVLQQATQEEADMVILMGGDHHLEVLHDAAEKRDAWCKSRVPRVAFCYESILDSRFPRSLEKSSSAAQAFTHFVHCDEKDSAFFEQVGAPARWLPQCVDHLRFVPGNGTRIPKVFFRGKADKTLSYDIRARLIEKLRTCPSFVYIAEEVDDEALMRLYAEYACAINLPGNFFGYNVRTFEALAAGSVLFQHKVENRPKNEALFNQQHLFAFSENDPEQLLTKIDEVTRNLGDFRDMAVRGREACLAAHTIEHRIREVVDFVDRTYKSGSRLHIGCGKNILPHHVNIDAIQHDRRIVVQDAGELTDITDEKYETIYACHVLEHFPYSKIPSVLANWAKKLRPGGKLYVAVPDVRFLFLAYVLGTPLKRILPPLFGGQEYPTNFHYVGFDRKTLTEHLRNAGFAHVELFDARKFGFTRWDCSSWPLSLNLVAQKAPVEAPSQTKFGHFWLQKRILVKRYGKGLMRFIRNKFP
ncbi:MAG: glycosyltransferase [Nibricoccus sp.]